MKILRRLALVVLGYLSLSAIVGAVPLILDRNGTPWTMPHSFLAHSPFHSFLIPGIILLLFNGLLPFVVFVFALQRRSFYGWWIGAQGAVLLGWLVVEVIMLRQLMWAHWLYAGMAGALLLSGWALRNDGSEMKTMDRTAERKHAVHN